MERKSVRKVLITASLVALLLLLIVGTTNVGIRLSKAQDKERTDFIELRDALRHGGLREAAKLKRHYVADFDAHWDVGLFDIEALTKNSGAVIVGSVGKKLEGRLTQDGQAIVTDYEIVLNEIIKGTVKDATTVIVSLPGGRVEFEDGTSAELRTPAFEHLKKGGVYALFLTESDTIPNAYTLVGGPQGVVEIVGDTVKSHGRVNDPISGETRSKTTDSFIRKVRDQAQKWPGPGRCCG